MQPGDRIICALLENQPVGTQFKHWFLHVTIVPWFRLGDPNQVIAEGLGRALATVAPFRAVGGQPASFRSRKNAPVRLVQLPTPFMPIEQKVRSYLHHKRAWLVDETTKVRQGFRPHVTSQGEQQLQQSDTFWCDRLYIVEQKGDYKEIMSEIVLKHPQHPEHLNRGVR
jgi:hypothetical protein